MSAVGVAVLGSTGTIGDNTLDVISQHPDRFRVVALGAQRNHVKLLQQCEQYRPTYAALAEGHLQIRLILLTECRHLT